MEGENYSHIRRTGDTSLCNVHRDPSRKISSLAQPFGSKSLVPCFRPGPNHTWMLIKHDLLRLRISQKTRLCNTVLCKCLALLCTIRYHPIRTIVSRPASAGFKIFEVRQLPPRLWVILGDLRWVSAFHGAKFNGDINGMYVTRSLNIIDIPSY
jgi:hypothetical protein